MATPFFKHPIEKWQHDLSKASKQGLLSCIDSLTWGRGYSRESLAELAETARREGRFIDAMASHARWKADPKGEFERVCKRQRAAKKAARARKRNTKRRAA